MRKVPFAPELAEDAMELPVVAMGVQSTQFGGSLTQYTLQPGYGCRFRVPALAVYRVWASRVPTDGARQVLGCVDCDAQQHGDADECDAGLLRVGEPGS